MAVDRREDLRADLFKNGSFVPLSYKKALLTYYFSPVRGAFSKLPLVVNSSQGLSVPKHHGERPPCLAPAPLGGCGV